MGLVVDLGTWRRRQQAPGPADEADRLEQAVRRLDPLVARLGTRDGRVDRLVETELLAITGAISMGLVDEAAERAERLLARLQHPALYRSG